MTDIFNSGYAPLHLLNIFIHIGSGTFAILIGVAQFFTAKGGRVHAWIGRVYLGLFIVVLMTAVIGSIGFGFRAFLASLTLSASYWLISGLRVLSIRDRGPGWLDNVTACVFIGLAAMFAGFMQSHPEQATLAAYIALGNVVSICFYDLARNLSGSRWMRQSWLNEHIYKMIGSHGALISAAGGNLFLNLQPWSIILPPVFSLTLVAFFIVRHPLARISVSE